jgi:hypothetical protein
MCRGEDLVEYVAAQHRAAVSAYWEDDGDRAACAVTIAPSLVTVVSRTSASTLPAPDI